MHGRMMRKIHDKDKTETRPARLRFPGYIRPPGDWRSKDMKKGLIVLLMGALGLATAQAFTEQEVVDACTGIIRDFRHMPERGIPETVLSHSRGLAIMRVLKIGLGVSGKGGEGVVVARTGDGWSGPSFIGTGGAGFGFQIGAEVTDFVFVLNNEEAVRAFSHGGNIKLGADASAAAGPVGRHAEADVMPTAAIYTYSRSKGLFAGVSLQGALIATQTDANRRYYGREVSPVAILHGKVSAPGGASRLLSALGR